MGNKQEEMKDPKSVPNRKLKVSKNPPIAMINMRKSSYLKEKQKAKYT